MRNTLRNSVALALAAALAGCASGGDHKQDNDNMRYATCRILAPLVSGGCSQYQAVSSSTDSGGSSGTARVGPKPRPQFTRWEEVAAPGVSLDELGMRAFSFGTGDDGNLFVNWANGTDSPLQYESNWSVLENGSFSEFFSMTSGLSMKFDGRSLPDQPGLLYVTYYPIPSYGTSPFVDTSHPASSAGLTDTGRRLAGVVADPYQQGWSYQSFGAWNVISYLPWYGQAYASSFGAPTAASAVPSAGSATFAGKLAGSYVSPDGVGSLASAELNVAVDFGARSLNFASAGTTLTRDLVTAMPAPNLDLTGTFTYSADSARFSGAIMDKGGTMQGTSTGRFYGPAAQELGGVFRATAKGATESFAGAYGAKR